jgi:hypothetical protein
MRIKSILISLMLVLGVNAANASEDEQWPIPNNYQDGHHSIRIEDSQEFEDQFSLLTGTDDVNAFICSSIQDIKCSNANKFRFNSILSFCDNKNEINCIESFEAINENGNIELANFIKYSQPNHPNKYTGSKEKNIPQPESPGIWSLPRLPHAEGDLYSLTVGISGFYSTNSQSANWESFYLKLNAVSLRAGSGARTDENGFENFPKCNQLTDSNWSHLSCGSGAEEYGKYRCAVKSTENNDCYLDHTFPKNVKFKVNLKLTKEPNGWLHGRVFDPSISITKNDQIIKMSLSGRASEVPTYYSGGQYSDLSKPLKDFWDKCLPSGQCPAGTRIAWSYPANNPNGNTRNVMYTPKPYGELVMNQFTELLPLTNDQSVAVPTRWSIRTLLSSEMAMANGCFTKGAGIKGIVSTNATVYSEGPPEYSDNNLQYKVAAPHLRPDNSEFKGSYNLVMRSDVARCIYGFSSAPIKATIQVVNEAGVNSIATTTIAEKNNWLSLSAYNFTFSNPTVKVKLSQDKSSKTTITCLKGKLLKKISGVSPKCPAGYKLKTN